VRNAFISELTKLAGKDPRIMLVVGDLGYGVVDEFATSMPAQFLNAGVAEQNMVGVAAGLASVGRKVFVYSIANFPTFRALEQIRNDVCFHGLDVTVVAVGAGVAYGTHGYTHHAVEDISIMRALPNMTVLSPADPLEARMVARFAVENTGPKYVRLGKNGERELHPTELLGSTLTSPLLVRQGTDLVIATTGAIASECETASKQLSEYGIRAQVLSFPIVKPFPQGWLGTLRAEVPIVTVEEHVRDGGFGSALLESLSDHHTPHHVWRLSLKVEHLQTTSSQEALRVLHKIDSAAIAAFVIKHIKISSA